MYGIEYPSPQLVLKGVGGLLSRQGGQRSFLFSLCAQNECTNGRELLLRIISVTATIYQVFQEAGPDPFCALPNPQSLTNTLGKVLNIFFELTNVRHRAKGFIYIISLSPLNTVAGIVLHLQQR